MKKINEFEIVDHGVDGSSYFPGCGVAYTEYDDCVTGIGNSFKEALEDAVNQLAESDYEINEDLETEIASADDTDMVTEVLKENYPKVQYTVNHHAYCSMITIDETFDSEDDARQFVADILNRRRKEFPVTVLSRGESWEIQEPDNCAMVPDQCGTLVLVDDSEEVEKEIERINENSELYYYVSIRVKG